MKKFSVLIALALLAVAGTGYAVTCAYDNVPAATLLVPYWKVSRNGSTGGNIPGGGVDTLCAITNVSSTGILVHATVWNKYTRAILDWNIPMTGYDVAFWSMRDVLNGNLNNNPNVQNDSFLKLNPSDPNYGFDPCGVNQRAAGPNAPNAYVPIVGFGSTVYIRFLSPASAAERWASIGYYSTPAYSGSFRTRVWDALDESGDITSFTNAFRANILDADNCGVRDGQYSGDFSGYMTLDVNNYCSRYFPNQDIYYRNDAIATTGWAAYGYTPNAIIGDIFYLDGNATAGNISGDPMVALEYDYRLQGGAGGALNHKTFYGKFWETLDLGTPTATGPTYAFIGDGREPLGNRYGFRYVNGVPDGAQSWAEIWRGDIYAVTSPSTGTVSFYVDLCAWWANCVDPNVPVAPYCSGSGLWDSYHTLTVRTFDNDENSFVQGGGPSGGGSGSPLYVFLEAQRYALLNNTDVNPANYTGGWIDITFPGFTMYNQTWVGIQHTAPAALLSVGHSASLIDEQFLCRVATGVTPVYAEAGNVP